MNEVKEELIREMRVRGIYDGLQQKIATALETALCSA